MVSFQEFLTAPAPCDLCRLGEGRWTRDRTGVVEWSLRGIGFHAVLHVCAGCAQAVNGAGLREKLPLLAIVMLVKAGRATRPPVQAYFQHQQWRKVWTHVLDRVDARTDDESTSLAAAKVVEARFFGESAKPAEGHGRQEPSVKIGVFLREDVMALLGEAPEVSFLTEVLPADPSGVRHECCLLLIGVVWLAAEAKYGEATAQEIVAGVLSGADEGDPAARRSKERMVLTLDECSRTTSVTTRADLLAAIAARSLGVNDNERGTHEALRDLARRGLTEFEGTLDRYELSSHDLG